MTQDRQILSPAEWKSVTDHVVELSQRMVQAVSSPPPVGREPAAEGEKKSTDR
jgi:hypothetical protein